MKQDAGACASGASLRDRIPGQSVVTELLRIQALAPPQNFLARLFGVDPVSEAALPWFAGALGEIAVGRILAQLGPEYTVLHAVPVGAGSADIDHLVIGPPGVFTLNTKHHSERDVWVGRRSLRVNGTKAPHVRHSVHEGERATKILSHVAGRPVGVTAMIVLVGASKLNVKEKHETVEILASQTLLRWFKHRPVTLSPDDLATLTAHAQRPELWHKEAPAEQDTEALMTDFAGLQQAAHKARSRRRLWGLCGMAGAAVIALLLWPTIVASWPAFMAQIFGF